MLQHQDFPPAYVSLHVIEYEEAKHWYQEAIRAVHRYESARGIDPTRVYGERQHGLERPRRLNISDYHLALAKERM
eukprot:15432007-Alexandrium_andersonii.AAC.1